MKNEYERKISTITASLDGRIRETSERLKESALKAGYTVTSDNRIGESDLAQLLKISPDTMPSRRRANGNVPRHYKIPGGNSRVTYKFDDVAAWIEGNCR
jgi:hypothetical protein